jgi:hypothetical protein
MAINGDANRLRELAGTMLQNSSDPATVKAAADILKIAVDIEKQQTDTRKVTLEETKLKHDLENAHKNQASENRKAYITTLLPVMSTLVVLGGLVFQFYQLQKTETDKLRDAENARWAESVKELSNAEKVSSASVFVKTWVNSPTYSERARELAEQMLYRPQDSLIFQGIFNSLYDPITPENFARAVAVNRRLKIVIDNLLTDPKTGMPHQVMDLPPQDKERWNLLVAQVNYTSAKICPAFSQFHASAPQSKDLSATYLAFCDFSGQKLEGVDLSAATLELCNFKGAKLTGVAKFDGFWPRFSAWWEADEISPELLAYFKQYHGFDPQTKYNSPQTADSYQQNLARLEKGSQH